MCATCGCGSEAEHDELPHVHPHGHALADGPRHDHDHDHAGEEHAHVLPDGSVVRHRHGPVAVRRVQLEHDLLADNDRRAAGVRARLAEAHTLGLNLMSSPGAGKTTLLVRTLEALRGSLPAAVIEGDQATELDADRIRATGAPAVQVQTGKACHLDARMIDRALTALPPPRGGVLFVENVGNLVCPASFDLGEARRVVLVSVTEGEDKPIKYPHMFARADLVLVTKIDLLPHVDLDLEALLRRAAEVRPGVSTLRVSAKTGEGMADWLAWIARERGAVAS